MQPVRETPATTVSATPRLSEAQAKWNLYQAESGHRYDAINPSSGACGIGQALPCSKLPCGLDDAACQEQFFTDYMSDRYGSWVAAWNYWQCTGYCTNNYGTILKSDVWW